MKKSILFLLSVLIFSGCVSTEEGFPDEKDAVFAFEQKIGENMIEAFRENDIEAFLQYIPSGGREQYGKEEFDNEQRELASRMGEIVGYRFLTKLEMEPAHQLVWAVRFKTHDLKGEELFREALFTIVVGEVDGQRRVFLFGFK